MEGDVFKAFVLWLVHESVGVEWDFCWNIYIGDTTLNLVTLASVYKFSHGYLFRFYRELYDKDARRAREYQICTAWFKAVKDFDDGNVKGDGMSWMSMLKYHEDDWGTKKHCCYCELIDWRAYYDQHLTDMRYDRHEPCDWCSKIAYCYDCTIYDDGQFVTNYCSFHRQIAECTYLSQHPVCECVEERYMSDDEFMRLVKELVPQMVRLGWRFFQFDDEDGIPFIEIYGPGEYCYDDGFWLDRNQQLACEYFEV